MEKKNKGNKILIIEDDEDIRTFACRVLQLEGYQILDCGTGEEGLALFEKNEIGLVLLDMKLPGVDGWTLLKKMREDPKAASIPIIIFTASVSASQKQRAINMGASDYLIKPLSVGTLKDAVLRNTRKKAKP